MKVSKQKDNQLVSAENELSCQLYLEDQMDISQQPDMLAFLKRHYQANKALH